CAIAREIGRPSCDTTAARGRRSRRIPRRSLAARPARVDDSSSVYAGRSPYPTPTTVGSFPRVPCETVPSDRSFSRKVEPLCVLQLGWQRRRTSLSDRGRERERRKSIPKPSNAPDASARREKRLRIEVFEVILLIEVKVSPSVGKLHVKLCLDRLNSCGWCQEHALLALFQDWV
ncbi:hypothetical protein MUK42_35601, partial [Musa troglodytarum]